MLALEPPKPFFSHPDNLLILMIVLVIVLVLLLAPHPVLITPEAAICAPRRLPFLPRRYRCVGFKTALAVRMPVLSAPRRAF